MEFTYSSNVVLDGLSKQKSYAITGLSNKRYHEMSEYYSSTALKYMFATSPKHFKAKYIDRVLEQRPASDEMLIGSLSHSMVLTPGEFDSEFYRMPDVDARTKEGKELKAQALLAAEGRTVVSEEQFLTAQSIAASVLSNPAAQGLLKNDFVPEAAFLWKCPFTGLNFRSKVDGCTKNYFIELKTGRDMSPSHFQRQAFNMNYDLSAAHYLEGMKQAGFETCRDIYFITVETVAPFVVQCYRADDSFLSVGHSKWLETVTKLESALGTGVWPGYIDENVDSMPLLYPPSWSLKNKSEEIEYGS